MIIRGWPFALFLASATHLVACQDKGTDAGAPQATGGTGGTTSTGSSAGVCRVSGTSFADESALCRMEVAKCEEDAACNTLACCLDKCRLVQCGVNTQACMDACYHASGSAADTFQSMCDCAHHSLGGCIAPRFVGCTVSIGGLNVCATMPPGSSCTQNGKTFSPTTGCPTGYSALCEGLAQGNVYFYGAMPEADDFIVESMCEGRLKAAEAGGTQGETPIGPPTTSASVVYGAEISGQYHLGPVDFEECEWHNACAPGDGYVSSLRTATGLGGEFLAGVQTGKINGGANCDACIQIKTATGRSIVARVVTYGATGEGDLDVSPSVYQALNTGEYPRSMTWQWAKCPDTGNLRYEFQTEANPWWTSFWVRNPRVPVVKVEVKSANHASFFTLRREQDGTLNDDSGFGEGAFTLRLTAADGQTIIDTFPSFTAGKILDSSQQFE